MELLFNVILSWDLIIWKICGCMRIIINLFLFYSWQPNLCCLRNLMSLRIVVQKIHSLSLFLSPDSHHVIKKKKRKVAVSKDVHQKEKEWCTLRKKFINKSRSQENSMKNKGLQELLDLDHRTFHWRDSRYKEEKKGNWLSRNRRICRSRKKMSGESKGVTCWQKD